MFFFKEDEVTCRFEVASNLDSYPLQSLNGLCFAGIFCNSITLHALTTPKKIMKIFIFAATIAIFTADISYARPIENSEASVATSLPIQRDSRPVTGSASSTKDAEKPNVLRQSIPTRHDSKSRLAFLGILSSEDSTSSEEPSTDAPDPPTDLLGNKTPFFGGEAEPATTPDYQPFQESPTDQGSVDSFTIGGNGRQIFSEGEDYSATLYSLPNGATVGPGDQIYDSTPIYPSPITTTGPSLDSASALNPNLPLSLDNLKLHLNSPSIVNSGIVEDGIDPFGATPVPQGSTLRTPVSSLPTDDSKDDGHATNQNEVNTNTVEKASSTDVEATEPGKPVDEQTGDKAYKTEKANSDTDAYTCLSEDTDIEQSPDSNTDTKVVTLEKITSNGTPIIFKISINPVPGDNREEIIEITKNELSDDKTPTADRQPNKADATAKIKPELSDDKLKRQEPKNDAVESAQSAKEDHSSPAKLTPCTTGQQPTGNKPSSKEPVEDPNQVKSTNESDKTEAENKVSSPEETNHGDSSGVGPDEKLPSMPTGTGNTQLEKTSLLNEVVDLIKSMGNLDKQTQDVATFNSPPSEPGSKHESTRRFRA